MITILPATRWYLIVVLISLMISDVLHSSMYLLAIWTSSLEKISIQMFCLFYNQIVFFYFCFVAFGVSSKKSLLRQVKELNGLYFFSLGVLLFQVFIQVSYPFEFFFFFNVMRQGSSFILLQASLIALLVKNPPAGSIPGLGRSIGERIGYPLQ